MNKGIYICFAFLLVLGLVLVNVPLNVQATWLPPVKPKDTWNTGTEVNIDLVANPAPVWEQLMAAGVKVDGPVQICHPFRQGQFQWVGEIRQLLNGKWVKLTTTTSWLPSIEGQLTACAQAPAAGTYALFGYYTGPSKKTGAGCVFDIAAWEADIWFDEDEDYVFEVNLGNDVPLGITFNYQVISTYPVPGLDVSQTGSTESWDDGGIYASFTDSPIDFDLGYQGNYVATLRISLPDYPLCTIDLAVDFSNYELPLGA